jgi:hypothetical protein
MTALLECADCSLLDESVVFDEDSNLPLCPECLDFLNLLDWADEVMEEFGWLYDLPDVDVNN